MWPDRVSNPGPLTYESGVNCPMQPGKQDSKIVLMPTKLDRILCHLGMTAACFLMPDKHDTRLLKAV